MYGVSFFSLIKLSIAFWSCLKILTVGMLIAGGRADDRTLAKIDGSNDSKEPLIVLMERCYDKLFLLWVEQANAICPYTSDRAEDTVDR